MDKGEPSWDYVRTALAVIEEGSLSAAARVLGLSQPTVGRHVEALEQALGTTLFTRSRNGLAPTATAQALRPHAEALRAASQALQRAVEGVGEAAAGPVRITASEIVATQVLPPILTALRERHPQLVIELVASNRVQDLLQRDADIAVRMTAPKQEALLARRIGAVPLHLFAHPRYLQHHGRPSSVDELASHALIGFDTETDYIRGFRQRGMPLSRDMFALRTDSDPAGLQALRAGFGIGFCQVPLARQTPVLEPVLPEQLAIQLPIWVVMHEDLRSSRRCRVTFDALVEGLTGYLETPADD